MQNFFECHLINRKKVAEQTIELIITKPKNFKYNIGQYVLINLNNTEKNISGITNKAFSISSHTDEDTLRFVMRKSESDFKQRCLDLEEGEKIFISSPKGNFSIKNYDKDSEEKKGIVFLASGMGIAPIIPMLMEFEKRNSKKEVHLFYSNRTIEKTTYDKELQEFKIENYKYHRVLTGIEPRINSDLLNSKLGDLKKYKFYIVGTIAFIKTMKQILEENNLTKNDYLVDNYG
ncbi:MAG: FAD-dependent oxidoreductase [Fusobacterium sp.]|nr:FAD-dependent oxidoreductase [Fusobacterium sp.]